MNESICVSVPRIMPDMGKRYNYRRLCSVEAGCGVVLCSVEAGRGVVLCSVEAGRGVVWCSVGLSRIESRYNKRRVWYGGSVA